MAQKNLLFTWELESFSEIATQPNLLRLRTEFKMRRHFLSRSLLIWEKVGVAGSWLLADFRNEKIYHINKRNDPEMEVSEASWDPENLISRFEQGVYGTHEGFVDWLKLFNLAKSDLEKLKRTDLSERRLDLEITHDDLLAAYELLREILTSPREWLIGLSKDNIQQIREYLGQWYKTAKAIWDINPSTSRETHTEILQQILQFCDEVKQQLGPTAAYLTAKKAEQLDPQMAERLETQVKSIADKVLESFREENNLSHESMKQDIVKGGEKLDQLNRRFENEIAKELVSKHKKIFAKQAEEHRQTSQKWLLATGGLIVVFGIVFYWLFEALRLGGTELIGVLQNVFTKGFLLTLIYFVLNRFIKNYTAHKHLEVVNRHRQNALDTFDDFVESAGDNRETRDAVLLAATNAIFDANQSGYLSAKMKGTESVNPLQQVIRAVFPGSSTKPEN